MAKKEKPNRGSMGNQLINKLIATIDPSYNSEVNLNEKNEDFKRIINEELALTKGISQGSIVDFTRALNSDKSKPNINGTRDPNDTLDLFKYITMNAPSIYTAYNEANRNKFIEMQDLQFIAKFVPSLGQCVKIALTHIVSSDDLSGEIQRVFDYGQSIDSEDAGIVTKALEAFETEHKLLKKLKNAYKSTLVSGNYFVYAVSYKKLFTEYDKSLKARKKNGGSTGFRNDYVKESVDTDPFEYELCKVALESADITEVGNALSPVPNDKLTEDESEFKKAYIKNLATFEYVDSTIPFCVLDSIPAFEKFESATEAADENGAADGTYTMEGGGRFNVAGTYLKFINARNVIPIMALDEIVAYLYVEPKRDKTKQNSVEVTVGQLSNIKKENAAEKAANLMAAKLEKVFSDKFVAKHTNFKKIIADCIMANGAINTDYKIQVIPVEDMFPFTIGENEDGRGTSMLAESLFPAKLLTNIMIKKNLNYVNKSGDKNIAYVKRGKSDIHGSNQVMRVIRGMQESQVTFQDMFNSSMVFHKFASDGNIVMPQSMSGNRLVEFEKMEGQDVNLGTDYEKYLENLAIVGTNVPPLLIEQINNADFAKAYTTAHAGFAGIVAEWQSDFESATTALYKRIIENLDVDDSIKQRVLSTFTFKLPRPKALSNSNVNENLSNAVQLAETFVNLKFGEATDDNRNAYNAAKYAVVKSRCPFIKWEELEQVADKAMMESMDIKDDTPEDDSLDSGNDEDDEF